MKKQIAFRLDVDLISRIDQHVERLRNKYPGTSVNRSDAIRNLLIMVLDSIDKIKQSN